MACGLGLPAFSAAMATAAGQNPGTTGMVFGVSGGLLAAAGGIWANLYAGRKQKQLDEEEAERNRLFNHDLAKAIARSIATLLVPLTKDAALPEGERAALRPLAERCQIAWVSIVDKGRPAFVPLLEGQITEAVRVDPAKPALGAYGTPDLWREVLRELIAASGKPEIKDALGEESETFKRAVKACHEGFARQLFNDLKHDFATKGQAYAAVHLRMMGEMLTLAREQAKGQADLAAKVEALTEAVAQRGEEVVAWIGQDRETGEKRLTRLRPLTSWLKSIDGRLAGIERKSDETIERLKRIEKQVERTEQAVRSESHVTRSEIANVRAGTNRRLRFVLAVGATSVLLTALASLVIIHALETSAAVGQRTLSGIDRSVAIAQTTDQKLTIIAERLRISFDDTLVALDDVHAEGYRSILDLVVESLEETGTVDDAICESMPLSDYGVIINQKKNKYIIQELESKQILPVDFSDGIAISDVVEFLRTSTGIKIQVDYDLLESFGINRDTQVAIVLDKPTVKHALVECLRSLNKSSSSLELIWYSIDDDGILITSDHKAKDRMKVALGRALGSQQAIADAYYNFGEREISPIHDWEGRGVSTVTAIRYFQSALEIDRRLGRLPAIADSLGCLAMLERKRGNPDTAMKYASESRDINERLQRTTAMDYITEAYIAADSSDRDTALALCQKAIDKARQGQDADAMILARMCFGRCEMALGHLDEAERNLNSSLRMSRESSRPDMACRVIPSIIELLVVRKREEEASAMFRQWLIDAERNDELKGWPGTDYYNAALSWKDKGRRDVAVVLLGYAKIVFERVGRASSAQAVQVMMSELLSEEAPPK